MNVLTRTLRSYSLLPILLVGLLVGQSLDDLQPAEVGFSHGRAGFAQEYLEQADLSTVAMFVAGCGGDQNPHPRRTLELAQQHGRSLSNAIEVAIISPVEILAGSIRAAMEGDYEAGRAMQHTTFPGPWAPSVEELVVSTVHRLAKKTAMKKNAEPLFIAKPLTEPKSFTVGIEGPACDREGNVFAVNFARQHTIGRTTPEGKSELFLELPQGSTGNGIRFGADGAMFIADYSGHNVLKVDPKTRQIEVMAHSDKMNQPNDLAIAADGTLYASDPNWSNGTGQLWRIDRDGKVTLLGADLGTTNGIDVSPDGKTLYVNESVQRSVWAYPLSAEGTLGERRLVVTFEEHSLDGMRCDVEGNLYVTRHGAGIVVKISPEGKILQEIDVLGSMPSNLCFGGPDGCTVYVTEVEHQRLVQFRVDSPGLSWQRLQRAGN